MSGSTLGSNSQTNSFSYRNIQAYYPFYKLDAGNSFYGLSKPQYSSSTYNSLAAQGGCPGSHGRIGRWYRSRGIHTLPFIPPSPPPIPSINLFTNSSFILAKIPDTKPDKKLPQGVTVPLFPLSINVLYTLPAWDLQVSNVPGPTITATGSSKNYNILNLNGPSGTGDSSTYCEAIQVLSTTMIAGKTYDIVVQCSSTSNSNKVGLGLIIKEKENTDYITINKQEKFNISTSTTNSYITFQYTPVKNVFDPQITLYLINNNNYSETVSISIPSMK